jgi:hypothetical protein
MKLMSKKTIKLGAVLAIFGALLFSVYYYVPYRLDFLGHYDKVLAHRCNSVDRLNSALKYYKGVELDLVYYEDTNTLDVNHPPSPSTGLNFKTYINSIISDEPPYLWLDIKNLNPENAERIFASIKETLSKKRLDVGKVLIETRDPEALPIFTNAGFLTSYYLPKRLDLETPENLEIAINNIKQVLKEQPEIGISTNFFDYDILHQYFPKKTKYIWVLVFPINKHIMVTKRILNDPTVEIVLTKYNTLSGNK